jgi:RNA polymerase sigma-70 factor (ECF subfamily)
VKTGEANTAYRDVQTLFETGSFSGLSDAELLSRFVARREEAAFEAIVERHGPMVWGACRRILRAHHDAEDAFQVTFLVLARKAASLREPEKLANWLYGVAYQTAMKVRTTRLKRQQWESRVAALRSQGAAQDEMRDMVTEAVDREVSRLPAKYRIPIVLCELESKSHREAAEILGWPIGTVSSRLSRARTLLAKRLSRPDVAFSSGALTALVAGDSANANMPAELVTATSKAASLFPTVRTLPVGLVSASVMALTEEILKTMLVSKIKVGLMLVLLGLVAGTGTVWAMFRAPIADQPSVGNGAATSDGQASKKKSVDRVTTRSEPQPSQTQKSEEAGSSAFPGNPEAQFGGFPDQPSYLRHGDVFFVIYPGGERFTVCNVKTKQVSTVRLPGSTDAPLDVSPILSGNTMVTMSLMIRRKPGPNKPIIDKLHVFCFDDWKWYPLRLKEPITGDVIPLLGGKSVAAYSQGRYVYAFSHAAKKWETLELPPDVRAATGNAILNHPATANVTVKMDSVVVEYDGHVHEFLDATGKWTHTDFRALINAAIEAAGEDAK